MDMTDKLKAHLCQLRMQFWGFFDERVAGHYAYEIQMRITKACSWDKIKDVILSRCREGV